MKIIILMNLNITAHLNAFVELALTKDNSNEYINDT